MNLIKFGEKYFDEMEIAIYRRKEIRAEVELNQISLSLARDRTVAIIRGIKDHRLGIAVVESDQEDKLQDSIILAHKMAKMNTPDERWMSLPGKQSYATPKPVEDELKSVEPDFFVKLLIDASKEIKNQDPRAMVAGGEAGSTLSESEIMNSHGLEVSQESGGTYFYLYLVGRIDGGVTPGIFDMDVGRGLELNVDRVVTSLLDKLKKAYTVVPAKNGEFPVIFEPFALAELLEFTIVPAISGERKVKGTSYLGDKLGQKVISEKITIVDDPWHPLNVEQLIADDEGVATRQTEIFSRGTFRSYLWDSYWGNVSGEGSTGNAYRNLKTGGLGIAPHNLVILSGSQNVEDILSSVKEGYLVSLLQGAHSSNPDTGDFSVVANPAFKIEDGEIVGSTVFMMSGNALSILNRVEAISKEQRMVYAMGKGVYPHILFQDVKIASVAK